MKEIKWEKLGNSESYQAKVGNVDLKVYQSCDGKWLGYITLHQLASTLRYGLNRKSPQKAQDDAIRLAKELLIDYHTAIAADMEKFDLVGVLDD